MAEMMTALYFHCLNHDPANPEWEERDVLMLSHGHTAPILYAALAHSGYFPVEELRTLRRYKTRLQGHPERKALPGVESTSGPLGEGLSQAAGYAYTLKYLDRNPHRFVYCLQGCLLYTSCPCCAPGRATTTAGTPWPTTPRCAPTSARWTICAR